MRTDIHAPSRIIPIDYEFIGFDYYGPEAHVETDQRIIHAHQRETGGDYSNHTHGGTCMVCGASAFYVGVFYHAKSNAYISCGEECSNKMEFSSGDWSAFRKATRASIEAHAGKQLAFRTLCEKGLQTAWFMWTASCDDLPVDETKPRRVYTGSVGDGFDEGAELVTDGFYILADVLTVRDIVGKLVRYGSISEKAEGFLKTLLTRIAKWPEVMAARKAEKEAAADCPTGRVTVEGVILKLAEHESAFGTVTKMTVKDKTGFIIWTTVPSGCEAKRGDTVKFTATLTVSDRDKKFGFGKRPALWVSPETKKAAAKARKEQDKRIAELQAVNPNYSNPYHPDWLKDMRGADERAAMTAEHGDTIATAIQEAI